MPSIKAKILSTIDAFDEPMLMRNNNFIKKRRQYQSYSFSQDFINDSQHRNSSPILRRSTRQLHRNQSNKALFHRILRTTGSKGDQKHLKKSTVSPSQPGDFPLPKNHKACLQSSTEKGLSSHKARSLSTITT